MMATISIRYYDRDGKRIMTQRTTDDYTPETMARWKAWLNDPTVEQACRFDHYTFVKSPARTRQVPR